MKLQTRTISLLFSIVCVLLLTGCAAGDANYSSNANNSVANVSDVELQQRVQTAIANASDVPEQLRVETNNGVVRLIGSLQCESCGGNRTPGGTATIQQSIGAVVRAVPGVARVEFALDGKP